MKPKKVTGEHCRFCGDEDCYLVKSECCNEWICIEPDIPNYRGDARCKNFHELYSLCKQHVDSNHLGHFSECQECVTFWGKDHQRLLKRVVNYPRFETPIGDEIKSFMARWSNSIADPY
jgi:hypothetical protein